MRQIKFDAIYRPTGEHFTPITLDFTKNIVTGNFDRMMNDWCFFSLDGSIGDAILREYTGLTDTNKVEIYVGDILRLWHEDEYVPNRDSGGGVIDYDREEGFSQLGIVGFTGCSFDYKTVKTIDGRHEEIHMPIDWLENYEVIGNIYENPELIKE